MGTTATQLIVSTGSTWMPGESPDSMASPVSQNPELIQLCTVLALPEWMDTITSGYSVLKAATMRANRPPASRGMAATLRRLALNERMLAAADSSPARPMKVFSTSWKKREPSCVGLRRLPLRSNKANWVMASNCAIKRLTCGCEVCTRRAAAVIEPVIMTARNASMCLRPIRGMAMSNPYRGILDWNWIKPYR